MSNFNLPESASSFLEEPKNMILATIRRDGRPQMTPVWFIVRNGEFVISTTLGTAKWKNLLREPRCTGLIDHPNGKYVSVTGTVELSTENHPHEVTSEIVRKYVQPEKFDEYMDMVRRERAERGIVRLIPERIIAPGFE